MCKLNVGDFFYGAFLSALLKKPGSRPVLLDSTDSRRIYRLETNNMSDCYVFAKFTTERKLKDTQRHHWIFNFSEAEVQTIRELFEKYKNVRLALIGATNTLAESELAFIDYQEAKDVLGIDTGVKTYRINIKTVGGQHGLRMYGSGRSDKLNGKDNTVVVTRKALEAL